MDIQVRSVKLSLNQLLALFFMFLVKIEIPNSKVSISGGGLPGKYNFAQMHFHWGKNDNEGSEHMIGNKFYPAEVNLKYSSYLMFMNTYS